MKYPYMKLVTPTEVKKASNGKLAPAILSKVKCGGQMWHNAAVAFNVMYDAAKAAGIKLQNIGDYRPYEAQLSMFRDRYDSKDHGKNVKRTFEGKTWYLKPGKSPSASPGTSNHGWGLAIDLNVTNPKTANWLCENGPKYGFYLQGNDPKSPEFELWHWQYCLGDKMPDGIAHVGGPAADVIDESNPEKITVGAKGEFVKKLQQALKTKGYYAGAVDGDFNQATGEAVKKLKTGHGLKEDMVAGAKVFAILDI